MTVGDVVTVLQGELVCGQDQLAAPVRDFAASDLLSDILHFEKEEYALITGLTNAQIVRTAEITGACCIVIVRGKEPQQAAVNLARCSGIPLILCRHPMYEACCRLSRFAEKYGSHGRDQGTTDTPGT